jgi:hypothetical protein
LVVVGCAKGEEEIVGFASKKLEKKKFKKLCVSFILWFISANLTSSNDSSSFLI